MDSDRIKYWLFGDRIPVTKALIVTNVMTFVYIELAHSLGPLSYLVFSSRNVMMQPWTLFTYPLVCGVDLISLAFSCYWLWVAGGSIERSWGTGRFLVYFLEMSAISAAALYVATLVLPLNVAIAGLWLVLAGLTVAFAMQNPETVVLFMFVIPLKLKYLAALSAALVFISYASQHVLLGLFALAGCAFSYWYVRTGRQFRAAAEPQPRGQVVRVHEKEGLMTRLNPFKWFRRHRSEKRLRKLFEDSGIDQDDRR